jgi:DNA-binding transcriptional ArsR family regulator
MVPQSPSLENKAGSDKKPVTTPAAPANTSVPESVPHFKCFEHIPDARVRRAKDYEQYLQISLERFPEFAERIGREIAFARGEQERSHVSDRDRIFLAIEVEELNKTEIAGDLDLPASTVYKHLRELLDRGVIYARHLPGRGNKPMLVYGRANLKP